MMMRRKKSMDATAERKLRAAGRHWRKLLFLRLASGVVIVAAALLAALGGVILAGRITLPATANAISAAIVIAGICAVFVAWIISTLRKKSRGWLAQQIERRSPGLMDRLNTLVFLDGVPRDNVTQDYFESIGAQTAHTLGSSGQRKPISTKSTRWMIVAALLACFATYLFFRTYRPWDRLHEELAITEAVDDTEELDLEPDSTSEMRATWGEVRITEPGGDLKLTKVDVLPLTVEAASSQRLQKAAWTTAVNGATQVNRPLPKPAEPNYAVYQPTLYLDELGLSDWDVMSYYASAATEGDAHYTSEIYFVEVRPFREDILKLEGGSGGSSGGQCLAKLSHLIQKQQDILRQTHRQEQSAATNDKLRDQDQQKLGDAQDDLKTATAHLYAEVAEKMEEQGVGTVLDQLALAEGTMSEAVTKLREPDNTKAQGHEQTALQQLVESRKDLVKMISNGRGGGGGSGSPQEKPPVAGMKPPQDQISDIEDFRDTGKAALAAVKEAREKQDEIALDVEGAGRDEMPELLEKQKAASKELKDFVKKNPAPFEGLEEDTTAATKAMSNAELALTQGMLTGMATENASKTLEKLETQLNDRLSRRSVSDVYRLKDMLEAQGKKLQEMSTEPKKATDEALAKAGGELKATKAAMADTLAHTPAGKTFGPTLHQALNGQPGRQLDQAAEKMQSGGQQAGEGAAEAGQSLQQIARAFEASQPSALRGAPGSSVAQGDGNGVGDGTRMLNSLIQRMTNGRQPSPEDLRKQLEEAQLALMADAQMNKDAVPDLAAVAQELKKLSDKVDLNVNAEALRKLVDKLETARLEMADAEGEKPLDPKLLNVDPSQAPSEFRDRVRRYFEKLSDG